MKYVITKKQFTNVVNNLIDVFLKNVNIVPDGRDDGENYKLPPLSYTLFMDEDKDEEGDDISIGWIITKNHHSIDKGCNNQLMLFVDTIGKIMKFVPIYKKKLFSKIILKHFSDKMGINIDCIYFDYAPHKSKEKIYRKKFKIKK